MQSKSRRRALDGRGLEEGALDEHGVGGVFNLAFRAAHHARYGHRRVGVGDDAHRRVKRAIHAVKCLDFLAIAGLTDDDGAVGEARVVEGVERLATFQHHVVGDIDDQPERAHAALLQALRHPVGRGAVLHASEDARRVARAVGRLDDDLGQGVHVRPVLLEGDVGLAQRAAQQRRELARDAYYGEAVGAVPGDLQVKDRLAFRQDVGQRRARNCGGVEFHDAAVVVGEGQFLAGAEHAVRGDAAQLGRFDLEAAIGDGGADLRDGDLDAGAAVRRAAHDAKRLAVADGDGADMHVVGVRVRFASEDFAHDEVLVKGGAGSLDALHLHA